MEDEVVTLVCEKCGATRIIQQGTILSKCVRYGGVWCHCGHCLAHIEQRVE